jgi:BON domain
MRYFRRRFLFPAILGFTLGTAHAADPDDIRLTLESRQSLNADAKLAALNLGVAVKSGIATLVGPVPSEELARRAEARVRVVNGLRNVRNELHVAPPADPEMQKLAAALEKSEPVRRTVPEPVLMLDPAGSALLPPKVRHNLTPVSSLFSLAKSDPAPATIAPARPTGHGPIPPSFPGEPAAATDPTPEIEKLRRGDERYQGLQASWSHGVVTIAGTLKKWPHLWEFAGAVSKLPGVERVRIEKVHQE